MKVYIVDIVRRVEEIKTFAIEASTAKEAEEKALLDAPDAHWNNLDTTTYSIMYTEPMEGICQ